MTEARKIPGPIATHIGEWRNLQRFWYFLHYTCGLGGVVAAVLASRFDWWLWGVVAAVSTALVTFLGPLQKGESYKHAYYALTNAVARFQEIPTVDIEWLLRRHREAQQIVLSQEVRDNTDDSPAKAPA